MDVLHFRRQWNILFFPFHDIILCSSKQRVRKIMQYTWLIQLKKNETYTLSLSLCVSIDCLFEILDVTEETAAYPLEMNSEMLKINHVK